MIESPLTHISEESPLAWAEFENFYLQLLGPLRSHFASIKFLELPIEMQLGLYIAYFKDNGLELDIQHMDFEIIPVTIREMFQIHEKMMSHYS